MLADSRAFRPGSFADSSPSISLPCAARILTRVRSRYVLHRYCLRGSRARGNGLSRSFVAERSPALSAEFSSLSPVSLSYSRTFSFSPESSLLSVDPLSRRALAGAASSSCEFNRWRAVTQSLRNLEVRSSSNPQIRRFSLVSRLSYTFTGRPGRKPLSRQLLAGISASGPAGSMSEPDEHDHSPRGKQDHEVTRVYVVSDIHTDHAENMEWVERLAATRQRSEGSGKGRDVLILAGDVTDNLEVLSRTFQLLTSAFHHVFFIPGNHELWCRHHDHHTHHHDHHTHHHDHHTHHTQHSQHSNHERHEDRNTGGKGDELPDSSSPPSPEPFTSLHKLTKVLQCCEQWGVRTEPLQVGNVWIVPLWSWHHQSFDTEPDIPNLRLPSLRKACMDYRVCVWPPHLTPSHSPPPSPPPSSSSLHVTAPDSSSPLHSLGDGGDALAAHFDGLNERPLLQLGTQHPHLFPALVLASQQQQKAAQQQQKAAQQQQKAAQQQQKAEQLPVVSKLQVAAHHTRALASAAVTAAPATSTPTAVAVSFGSTATTVSSSSGSQVALSNNSTTYSSLAGSSTTSSTSTSAPVSPRAPEGSAAVPLGGSGVAGSGAEGTVEGSGAEGVQIISFSHFLPRIDLLPEKRMLLYPNLAKMAGSHWLEARVRSVHGPHGGPTACHVFGHTHFHWDSWVDGIRYVQAPLCYPRERERRRQAARSSGNGSSSSSGGGNDSSPSNDSGNGSVKQSSDDPWLPFLLYDSSTGGLKTSLLQSHWSNYYRSNPRQPNVTELAPWVAARYAGRMRMAGRKETRS